jgi:hypothetical protein
MRRSFSVNAIRFLLFLLFGPLAGAAEIKPPLPVFEDVTSAAGLRFKHSYGDFDLSNIVEGTGSGAAFFDYDNDGWLDLYFVNGCWLKEVNDNRGRKLRGKLHNVLYRNNGDGTFTDVTEKAGVGDRGFGTGCSAADYDSDGDQDLYVLNYGRNVLYRNNGDGSFTDVTDRSGLGDAHWSLSAPWFDYDGDGDLDVYVANYLEYDNGKFRSFYAAAGYPGPLSYSGQPDTLYRNNGDGTFTAVTQKAGVYQPDGRAMSATVADLNNDGFLDIYVPNDAMENYFFRNTGEGTFLNEGLELGMAFGEGGQGVSSMGPSIGDVDRDGWQDIYIPDMGYGCLLMNRQEYFEDRTAQAGLALVCGQYTGWGGLLLDYDNDGWLDIFVANGNAHHEYTEEDVLMRNDGTGHFVDVAVQAGPYFREKYVGRGVTYADYDNDGDLDILVININDQARLLRNQGGHRRSWLLIDARLADSGSPALGARVTVTCGTLKQIRDLIPVSGFLSQADSRCHFGLGDASEAQAVEVRWPDGRTTTLTSVDVNQILVVTQPSATKEM